MFEKKANLCRKYFNKVSYCGNVLTKLHKFCGNLLTKQHKFWWIFQQNSVKLGWNLAAKQCKHLWKFLQHPANCKNFRAAMLPHCKGFCDSDSAPLPPHVLQHCQAQAFKKVIKENIVLSVGAAVFSCAK